MGKKKSFIQKGIASSFNPFSQTGILGYPLKKAPFFLGLGEGEKIVQVWRLKQKTLLIGEINRVLLLK